MIENLLRMNAAAYDAVRTEFRLGMTEKDIEAIILNIKKFPEKTFRFAET